MRHVIRQYFAFGTQCTVDCKAYEWKQQVCRALDRGVCARPTSEKCKLAEGQVGPPEGAG